MKIKGYNNGSKEEILKLEKKYRLKLPQDYINHLIRYNGGDVDDAYLYVKDLNEYMLMGYFFGINIENGVADTNKINDEYDDDIPKKSLLIGSDEGSGFLLLVCDGENNGIWYYDHTYFFKQSTDELNTYFICETFTEFLQILENTKFSNKDVEHTPVSLTNTLTIHSPEGFAYVQKNASLFEEPIVVEKLQNGEQVEIVSLTGNWYFVKTHTGNKGYIHNSKVKIN